MTTPPPKPPYRPTSGGGRPPEPSKREQMRDAVRAVVDQKAAERRDTTAQDVANRQRAERKPKKLKIVAFLLVLALLGAGIPALAMWRHPFPQPTGSEADRHARQGLVFAARLVEQHRADRGVPPASLSELGLQLPGVAYRRVADTWELSTASEDRVITLRSTDDTTSFLNPR